MPRARKYTKKIQLWGSVAVSDGFGGNTVSDSQITDLWANLTTLNAMKYQNTDFGDINLANSVEVKIRYNPNLSIDYKNNFIVYLGDKYFFSENTVVTDFRKNTVTFVMIKNVQDSN